MFAILDKTTLCAFSAAFLRSSSSAAIASPHTADAIFIVVSAAANGSRRIAFLASRMTAASAGLFKAIAWSSAHDMLPMHIASSSVLERSSANSDARTEAFERCFM